MSDRELRMLAYGRASTREQGDSGLGLEAQFSRVESECVLQHWELVEYREEIAGYDDPKPVLEELLLMVQDPGIDGLIVAALDRLHRTVFRIASIIEDAVRQDWKLVSLRPRVDMTDPYGIAMAQMAAVFAQLERAMISKRTSEALQAKIARGEFVGRPPVMALEAILFAQERVQVYGYSWRAAARALSEAGFQTPQGGRVWDAQSVKAAVERLERFGADVAAPSRETA